MAGSDNESSTPIARSVAAPQRTAVAERRRGPHPLAGLMALAAQVCGDDHDRLSRVLAGVRAYQDHPYRRHLPVMPVVGRAFGTTLLDYGGAGPTVVFVPSPINPATILDLTADNSLLRWLSGQGLRPLLVDWGDADADWLASDLGELAGERLAPLLRGLGEPVAVAGYCLGGTLALAASTLVPVARIALLATPWHFAGYGEAARTAIAHHAATVAPLADALGAYPVELLQPGFWELDREAVAAKFEAFAALDPASPKAAAFVALEDWTNSGAPLPRRAADELFRNLFAADEPGRRIWQAAGKTIEPSGFPAQILDIVALKDRIVPPAAALALGNRLEIDARHVGLVIAATSRETVWQPLANFLRGA